MSPWDLGVRRERQRERARESKSCSLFSYNEVIIIITFNLCCIGNVFFIPGNFHVFYLI